MVEGMIKAAFQTYYIASVGPVRLNSKMVKLQHEDASPRCQFDRIAVYGSDRR